MRVCVVRRDDPGRDVQGRCRGACSGSSLAAINWAIARERRRRPPGLCPSSPKADLSARSRVAVGAGSQENGSRQDTMTGSRGTLGVLLPSPRRPVQCARRERRFLGARRSGGKGRVPLLLLRVRADAAVSGRKSEAHCRRRR
ncbi:unnamed protein product [Ixodes persulcatus]